MSSAASILPRLRQFTTGVLAFGESVGDVTEPCKFVLDPSSGEPVLPVTVEALRSEELMLYLPDDGLDNPECLQVHAAARSIPIAKPRLIGGSRITKGRRTRAGRGCGCRA
jgi:hypothetical protein